MSSSPEIEEIDPDVLIQQSSSKNGNVNINVNPEYIIKFIQRVKTFPILYNQDHENFRNSGLKQKAWKEVAEEFGQTDRWCLRKWVSLRDYFVKRKKRIRMGKTLRPWIYYNELSFLNIIYGHDQLDYYPPNLIGDNNDSANANNHYDDGSRSSGYMFYSIEDMQESYDGGEDDEEGEDDGQNHNHQGQGQLIYDNHDDGGLENVKCEEDVDNEEEEYEYEQPLEVMIEDEDVKDHRKMIPSLHPQRRSEVHANAVEGLSGTPAAAMRPTRGGTGSAVRTGDNSISIVGVTGVSTKQERQSPTANGGMMTNNILRNQLIQQQNSSSHHESSSASSSRKRPILDNIKTSSDASSILTGPRVSVPGQFSASDYSNINSKRKKFGYNQEAVAVVHEEGEDADLAHDDSRVSNGHVGGGERASLVSSLSQLLSNSTSDPYDLFCLSIAAQLKKMPRDKAMLMQIEIMNLMYQSEFDHNNDSST